MPSTTPDFRIAVAGGSWGGTRLRRGIVDGHCLIRLGLDVLDFRTSLFRSSLGLYAADPAFGRPERIEVLGRSCRTRRLRSKQKIQS